MPAPIRILLVEDNPADARLTQELLRESDELVFNCLHVETLTLALTSLNEQGFDVVLLDLSLSDTTGMEGVIRINIQHPAVPIIVLSGQVNDTVAITAVQQGAQDYLIKGHGDGYLIGRMIRYAIERKRIEVQLVDAKNAAENADRAKTAFLAAMGHELRTPLNAILGFGSLIARQSFGPTDPKYVEFSESILSAGQRMWAMVEDVLTIAQLQSGICRINLEDVDLCGLVAEIIVKFQREYPGRAADITFESDPESLILRADVAAIEAMLLKLLSNAVKFSDPGTAIDIRVAVERDGWTVLIVKDRGIGMTAQQVEDAVKLFRQADERLERKYEGGGLGLCIVNKLIECHGGHLQIVSAPGQGTEVTLRFKPAVKESGSTELALVA